MELKFVKLESQFINAPVPTISFLKTQRLQINLVTSYYSHAQLSLILLHTQQISSLIILKNLKASFFFNL